VFCTVEFMNSTARAPDVTVTAGPTDAARSPSAVDVVVSASTLNPLPACRATRLFAAVARNTAST
jgi:hypothetical protein